MQFISGQMFPGFKKGPQDRIALLRLFEPNPLQVLSQNVLSLADHGSRDGGLIVNSFLQHKGGKRYAETKRMILGIGTSANYRPIRACMVNCVRLKAPIESEKDGHCNFTVGFKRAAPPVAACLHLSECRFAARLTRNGRIDLSLATCSPASTGRHDSRAWLVGGRESHPRWTRW